MPPSAPPSGAGRIARARRRPELTALVLAVAAALALVVASHADRGGVGWLLTSGVASLLLFAVCGDALGWLLTPAAWRPARPAVALAFGAAASGLVLSAFGFAHVPLHVSLWLTLAIGLLASLRVRRARRPVEPATAAGWERPGWLAALAVTALIGVIPSLIAGVATVPGENPDAHQVVGIAVLFQHVPPQGTDNALPLDTVPPSWRFRYPIFYPLAAASNLSGLDPIRVFSAMSGLLMALAVAGFALLAVSALGAPKRAGPALAVVLSFGWVPVHLAWHPYWNQLWGFALFPYALAFGWRAAHERDRRSWAAFALLTFALTLAYPLAMPYPLGLVAIVALAYGRRPHVPRITSRRAGAAAVVGGLVALLFIAAAVAKLAQGLGQVLSPHSTLWTGDVTRLLPPGKFAGLGGGVLVAAAVVVIAAIGLGDLPRRFALALGGAIAALLLLDLRFRLVRGGAYMDFKHLSYVGMVVLTVAAAAAARWIASPRRGWAAAGLLIALGWTGAALAGTRQEAFGTGVQATTDLFEIRSWAARLPAGASVRLDIPPTGEQLWAVYMLGSHPVDALQPVVRTTYAHAPAGLRADYSLALRYLPSRDPNRHVPAPPVAFAVGPPLFENSRYVLRRIAWPRTGRWAPYVSTASTKLVES